MPRKRKPTQPAVAPTGLAYGMNQDLVQAQQAVPLPQAPGPADLVASRDESRGMGAAPPGGGPAPVSVGGGGPSLPPELLMQLAQAAPSPGAGALHEVGPADFATAGISLGPGPGPGVLGVPDQSPLLRTIAQETGSPYFLQLAQRARVQAH